jgi:hypothetical protein
MSVWRVASDSWLLAILHLVQRSVALCSTVVLLLPHIFRWIWVARLVQLHWFRGWGGMCHSVFREAFQR